MRDGRIPQSIGQASLHLDTLLWAPLLHIVNIFCGRLISLKHFKTILCHARKVGRYLLIVHEIHGFVEFWILRFPIVCFRHTEDYYECKAEGLLTFLFIENVKEREAWTWMDHKQVQFVRFSRLSFGWWSRYGRLGSSVDKLFSKAQIFCAQFCRDLTWSGYLFRLPSRASRFVWQQNFLIDGGRNCNN